MNKKQIQEAVRNAIAYSDQVDAEPTNPYSDDDYSRKWSRLSAFVIALQTSLSEHAPEVNEMISEFQTRVIYRENPLLDAGKAEGELQ